MFERVLVNFFVIFAPAFSDILLDCFCAHPIEAFTQASSHSRAHNRGFLPPHTQASLRLPDHAQKEKFIGLLAQFRDVLKVKQGQQDQITQKPARLALGV